MGAGLPLPVLKFKAALGEAYSISMAGTEVKRRDVIGHMKKMKKKHFIQEN
jgi:hypothetical protein